MNKSGKKLALVIGCMYRSTRMQLNGTINDATNIVNALKTIGFLSENIRFMHDNLPPSNDLFPKKANILRHMSQILADAQTGDDVFIYFAGHGVQLLSTQIKAEHSGVTESDGKDEALVPVDVVVKQGKNGTTTFDNIILDDTINMMLRRYGKEGVRVYMMFDCCHSGTACDLRYNYSFKGRIDGKVSDSLTKNEIVFDEEAVSPLDDSQPIRCTVITLSGCKDEQVSWEDVPLYGKNRTVQGALTSAFIHTIETNIRTTRDVFLILRNVQALMTKHKQNPKISSNIPLHNDYNDNNRFILDGYNYLKQNVAVQQQSVVQNTQKTEQSDQNNNTDASSKPTVSSSGFYKYSKQETQTVTRVDQPSNKKPVQNPLFFRPAPQPNSFIQPKKSTQLTNAIKQNKKFGYTIKTSHVINQQNLLKFLI